MKDPGAPNLKELKWRIALCTQRDVVVNGSTMELRRVGVILGWARIKSYYGLPAFVGHQGFTIVDAATRATHAITVRMGYYLDYASAAWVYEERLISPPRWYKILGFSESGNWVTLTTRMVEKSDDALPPHSDFSPQPTNVEL
jgi:hypothetical protein